MAATPGVATLDYLPLRRFNLASPLLAIADAVGFAKKRAAQTLG